MYKLGSQFTNKNIENLVSQNAAIIKGNNYRFTLLSTRLIRLEYSSNGVFNDYETMIVKNRQFEVPEWTKQEDDNILKIDTIINPQLAL